MKQQTDQTNLLQIFKQKIDQAYQELSQAYSKQPQQSSLLLPQDYLDVMEEVAKLDGVEIRTEESFGKTILWAHGNTFAYRDEMKALGFSWDRDLMQWRYPYQYKPEPKKGK